MVRLPTPRNVSNAVALYRATAHEWRAVRCELDRAGLSHLAQQIDTLEGVPDCLEVYKQLTPESYRTIEYFAGLLGVSIQLATVL